MDLRLSNTVAERLPAPACFAVPVLHDNYAWVVVGADDQAVVIDPGEATPVVAALARHNLRLAGVLATHHHHDHVGGIAALVDAAPTPVAVWASAYDVQRCRVPRATHAAHDGQAFVVGGIAFVPLAVPGHTLGAVAFYAEAHQVVFTGDTLFLAGCGRLFEGDAATMWHSLQRLRALPEATRVCCGHDYVDKNLRFAGTVLPPEAVAATDDPAAERARRATGGGEASGPLPAPWATLATEKRRNPFLQADAPALQARLGTAAAPDAFAELRRRRDGF